MTPHRVFTHLVLVFVLCTINSIQAGTISQSLQDSFFNGVNKMYVIVEFPPVLSRVLNHPALNFLRGTGKTSYTKSLLKKFSSHAQSPLRFVINQIKPKLKFTPFYISNAIFVRVKSFESPKISQNVTINIHFSKRLNLSPLNSNLVTI